MGKKTAAGKRDGVECCEWRNRIGCFIRLRRTEETQQKKWNNNHHVTGGRHLVYAGVTVLFAKRKKDIYFS